MVSSGVSSVVSSVVSPVVSLVVSLVSLVPFAVRESGLDLCAPTAAI